MSKNTCPQGYKDIFTEITVQIKVGRYTMVGEKEQLKSFEKKPLPGRSLQNIHTEKKQNGTGSVILL